MRNYIIISKEQADAVRGKHGKYSALEPVLFPDGKYAIPEKVLDDPEFADILPILKKYQEEEEIQDIQDIPKEGEIKKGRYYLSKEYWVIKSKVDNKIDSKTPFRLSDFISKEGK